MAFEFFEHTADVGLRVKATSVNDLFTDAARGLFSLIAPNLNAVRPVSTKRIALTAEDYDYLFFDWLNELLYAFESQHLVLAEFDVQIQTLSLHAECHGEVWSAERHGVGKEVKAITYHGLKVEQHGGQWSAEVIVDI
jgi:SHS2 domain-containing protein